MLDKTVMVAGTQTCAYALIPATMTEMVAMTVCQSVLSHSGCVCICACTCVYTHGI